MIESLKTITLAIIALSILFLSVHFWGNWGLLFLFLWIMGVIVHVRIKTGEWI